MRCANPLVVRHPDLGNDDDFNNFRWRVPLLTVPSSSIDLLHLSVIHVNAKAALYCVGVRRKGVRGQLEASVRRFSQLFHEQPRIMCRATAQVPRKNQFRIALDSDETISVSEQVGFDDLVLFLHPDPAPNFVAFNVSHAKPANPLREQLLSTKPSYFQEAENCVTVNACDAFCAANRVSLKQKLQAQQGAI